MEREHDGKKYSAIIGWWKDKDGSADQAYRYDKKTWTEETARNHCKEKKGTFEAALKGVETQEFRFAYPIKLEGVEYPADIEILKEGVWEHPEAPDGVLEVTKEDLETFVTNFKKKLVGDQLPLDREHKAEPTHALGWITNLWIKAKDGICHLWAKLNITDEQTREDLKSGCLKYISPTILIGWRNPEDKKNYDVIRSAALTNMPYIKNMAPAIVNFSEITNKEVNNKMEEKEIKKLKEDIEKRDLALKEKQTKLEEEYTQKKSELERKEAELEEARVRFGADQEAIKKAKTKLAEFNTLKADFDTMKKDFEDTKKMATTAQKVAEVANAEAKILRNKNNEIEADVKITELVEKGKVLPAQKDYLKKVLLAEEGTEIELTEGEGDKKTTRKISKTEAMLELLAAGPAKVELGQRAEVTGKIELSDIETVDKILKMSKKDWADVKPEDRDKILLQLNDLQNSLAMKKK